MVIKKAQRISIKKQLENWSKKVRERDGNKCFICNSTKRLQAHHILPKKLWSKHKLDLNVGISLCCRHHAFGKESVHRGIGDLLLFEKLQKERPEQYAYIKKLIDQELNNY